MISVGRPWRAVLLVLVVVVGAAPAAGSRAPLAAGQRAELHVPVAGIREHLSALQRIAERNGGNRAAGTAGYDASARYVAARMRAAGYRVRLQGFSFAYVVDRTPPVLRPRQGDWSYRAGRDYATLGYSGSGEVEARVAAVDLTVPSPSPNASTSGCEASDFTRFPREAVALLQRGTCTFREKVANAIAAGASAAIVFNEGNPGRKGLVPGTLGAPQVEVPALATSFEVGEALRDGVLDGPTGITARLVTDVLAERRRTRNVIAETRAGTRSRLVVVGAHLDSVRQGAGLNDNGSGSATILEVAERLARERPRNRLRFVWWGAEELGLLGSRHYVERLSPAGRKAHALYLNFDMVASRNFVFFVYDGDGSESRPSTTPPPASAAVERVFTRYFAARGLPYRETNVGGGSDHFPFVRAGIPVGGLFTGADGLKSPAQASAFGGRAGEPFDPCYHRRCDGLANVSATALTRIAQAALHAIRHFAADTSALGRTP